MQVIRQDGGKTGAPMVHNAASASRTAESFGKIIVNPIQSAGAFRKAFCYNKHKQGKVVVRKHAKNCIGYAK